jgi:hypothetical protein
MLEIRFNTLQDWADPKKVNQQHRQPTSPKAPLQSCQPSDLEQPLHQSPSSPPISSRTLASFPPPEDDPDPHGFNTSTLPVAKPFSKLGSRMQTSPPFKPSQTHDKNSMALNLEPQLLATGVPESSPRSNPQLHLPNSSTATTTGTFSQVSNASEVEKPRVLSFSTRRPKDSLLEEFQQVRII